MTGCSSAVLHLLHGCRHAVQHPGNTKLNVELAFDGEVLVEIRRQCRIYRNGVAMRALDLGGRGLAASIEVRGVLRQRPAVPTAGRQLLGQSKGLFTTQLGRPAGTGAGTATGAVAVSHSGRRRTFAQRWGNRARRRCRTDSSKADVRSARAALGRMKCPSC